MEPAYRSCPRLGAVACCSLPAMSHLLPIALTLVALPLLLVGETRGPTWLKVAAKPIASAGFLWLGWLASSADGVSITLMVALVLCAVGDVCLLSKARPLFLAGLVSFLLGHLGYVGVFLLHGLATAPFLAALVVFIPAAFVVGQWLWPHLPDRMRGPVIAYITIITAMVAAAIGAAWPAGRPIWVVGALLFFVSDLFVARNRFVTEDGRNRVIGLPLYYTGQLVLAATLATAAT